MSKNTEKEKKWTITFSNGYCGCDVEEEFFGTYEEAVEWVNEYLPDYAETYTHIAFGWDEEINEDEFEEYCENCGFDFEESEEVD